MDYIDKGKEVQCDTCNVETKADVDVEQDAFGEPGHRNTPLLRSLNSKVLPNCYSANIVINKEIWENG